MKRSARFVSEKSLATGIVLGGSVLLFTILLVNELLTSSFTTETLIIALFLFGLTALFSWIWFGTYYQLTGHTLLYRSGPIHGSIDIHSIRQIKPREKLWPGLKPALGMHGLVICYNRWDEIYLSPKAEEEFISSLLQVNPAIQVLNSSPAFS